MIRAITSGLWRRIRRVVTGGICFSKHDLWPLTSLRVMVGKFAYGLVLSSGLATQKQTGLSAIRKKSMVVLETHDLRSDKPDLWDVMDGRDHLVVASLVFFWRPKFVVTSKENTVLPKKELSLTRFYWTTNQGTYFAWQFIWRMSFDTLVSSIFRSSMYHSPHPFLVHHPLLWHWYVLLFWYVLTFDKQPLFILYSHASRSMFLWFHSFVIMHFLIGCIVSLCSLAYLCYPSLTLFGSLFAQVLCEFARIQQVRLSPLNCSSPLVLQFLYGLVSILLTLTVYSTV